MRFPTAQAISAPVNPGGFANRRCRGHLARSIPVIAALNIGALGLGLAAAGLSSTLVGLVVGLGLNLVGVDAGPDIGLIVGILTGLVVGGWVAGGLARHSFRFHGAVAGLLFAGLIILIARLGGGPEATLQVLWLALIAIAVGGFSGWLAGRRKTFKLSTASPSDDRGPRTEESPDSKGQGAG